LEKLAAKTRLHASDNDLEDKLFKFLELYMKNFNPADNYAVSRMLASIVKNDFLKYESFDKIEKLLTKYNRIPVTLQLITELGLKTIDVTNLLIRHEPK
jgi:hypothetical protein